MQIYLKKLLVLVLLFCIQFGITTCRPMQQYQLKITEKPLEKQSYFFNAATIYNDIVNGTESYTQIDDFDDEGSGDLIYWSQAEYYEIVESVFENIWQEPIEDYKLREIFFRTGCMLINEGFYYAHFEFYRVSITGQKEVMEREVKLVSIDSISEQIELWTDFEYFLFGSPSFFNEKQLVLDPGTLTADGALKIAEKAAGIDYRKQFQNDCDLHLRYDANGEHDGWEIDYFSSGHLLTIVVDAQTGEYEINSE